MIKFDKNHKCENLGILTKEEARAYIAFLGCERERHGDEIDYIGSGLSILNTKSKFDIALRRFWDSAIRRHCKDIEEIDHLVTTLKGFYGI